MKSFSQYLYENPTTLHAFDMDETIFGHDHDKLRVHVRDKKTGRKITSLTNTEFNTHKLHPNHEYDFSDFRSANVFKKSAYPIRPMLAKMKAIHNRGGKVEIVTARSDMDNKNEFGNHLKKFGIDINKIHVRRSGNLNPRGSAAVNKAEMISNLVKQHGYTEVHLYDDSHENLNHFLALKKRHPNVTFHAHHVQHNPSTGKVTVTHKTA
jgi:HAD superfamily, subfamily IIIB (Acid phosphatase)